MCACGGDSSNAAAGSAGIGAPILSGALDPRYGGQPETVPQAIEGLIYSQGFWTLVVVVIGGTWALSWIRGGGQKKGQ